MRVAIYARVSTSDKDQNPDTQLLPLREFCQAQGWTIADEFVDHASANDLRGRRAWREVLDLADKRKIDVLLVWKLDRVFRSVAHATSTLSSSCAGGASACVPTPRHSWIRAARPRSAT